MIKKFTSDLCKTCTSSPPEFFFGKVVLKIYRKTPMPKCDLLCKFTYWNHSLA